MKSDEPTSSPPASVSLNIAGKPVTLEFPMPAGPVRPADLLPLFRQLADAIVRIGVEATRSEGRTISCRAGCGACCRQLVPITTTEARRMKAVVDDMPEPRRTEIRGRFARALEHFEAAGVLERLRAGRLPEATLQEFGLEYFRQGVPCPFLENESCSFYEERPIACREFLVTSPAEHCRQPTAATVRCVKLPGKVSSALSRISGEVGPACDSGEIPVLPLILALEWVAQHPEEPPPRPAPELLTDFFRSLAAKTPADEAAAAEGLMR